jgi:hypothetical protein
VALHRGFDGTDPARREPAAEVAGTREIRRATRSTRLAGGSLACPSCDAPVLLDPAAGPYSPASALLCPWCGTAGPLREFLSLADPARPARVETRVVYPRP